MLLECFRDRVAAIRVKARTIDMFPLPSAWICEARLPSEERILGFWDNTVLVISGTCTDTVCSFSP